MRIYYGAGAGFRSFLLLLIVFGVGVMGWLVGNGRQGAVAISASVVGSPTSRGLHGGGTSRAAEGGWMAVLM
jgi:hypothetical protein